MTPTPNPTAEQIVAQAIAIMNYGDALDMETFAEEAEASVAALRAHGLLSEGAPSEEQIKLAARAIFGGYVTWDEARIDWQAYAYDREKAEHVARRALTAAGVAPQGFGESATVAASPKADKYREKLIASLRRRAEQSGSVRIQAEELHDIADALAAPHLVDAVEIREVLDDAHLAWNRAGRREPLTAALTRALVEQVKEGR